MIEGLCGEDTITSIWLKYGITVSLYYKWNKDFLDTGKKRLSVDTDRNVNAAEVEHIGRSLSAQ